MLVILDPTYTNILYSEKEHTDSENFQSTTVIKKRSTMAVCCVGFTEQRF